jgi:hypothetical protein
VSHLPSFARVYCDGTGGGTVIKLNISEHAVYLVDHLTNKSWGEQLSGCGRSWAHTPLTGASNQQLGNSTPSTNAASNTAPPLNYLGGDYSATVTTGAETLMGMFYYQVPAPYTLFMRGVYFSLPLVTTLFSTTSLCYFEPFIIANASSKNLSTATWLTGISLGASWSASATAAAGTTFTGNSIAFSPQTPIACLPATYIVIGWKQLNNTSSIAGVFRGTVLVDGYWE